MKHILLINPWIFDFTAYDFWLKPLGLLQIGAIVRQNTSCQVHLIDCLDRFHPGLKKKSISKPDGRGPLPKEEVTKPEVLKFVPRKFSRYGLPLNLFMEELAQQPAPEAVLVTCGMTYWYPGVQLVSELIRQKFGQVPIILGGVYPTLLPEHARLHSGADFIVSGPGENRILPILREILGDRLVQERKFKDLDDLPLPAYDLLRHQESLPILTSRGCPFRCSFCASSLLYPHFEQKRPQQVIADIQLLVQRMNCRHLAFYDDALLLNSRVHFKPILKGIINSSLTLSLHSPNGLHVQAIDAEMASLMKAAGFVSIYLSQESLDPSWLKDFSPKVESEDLLKAVKSLEAAGFNRHNLNVYLLAGLPGQDWDRLLRDIDEVIHLGLKPRLAFFSPIPGTKEWKKIIDQGLLKEDSDPLLQNKVAFLYLQGEEVILKLREAEKRLSCLCPN
ncbi:MAG: B12-binding domain-containing radical SAM protein [Candidatus Aminicenantes bacterium]|nr:B12-binding domain-containing radical SAM protein [Candidatus Aminicenantes bacterium]